MVRTRSARSDTPVGPGAGPHVALRLLQVAVAVQFIGAAWFFEIANSSTNGYVLLELGWSPESAGALDRIQSALLLVLAGLALARPHARALVAGTALFAVEGLAQGLGDERFSHLAPFAAAIRVVAPLVLVLLARGARDGGGGRARARSATLLRVAIAAAFVVHGIEAWQRHPAFVDLILACDLRLRALGLGTGLDEAAARSALGAIAIHDVAVAALLVTTRWRALAAWAGVWAGAAALARVVQGGGALWFEAAIRTAHGLAPLALALLWPRRAAPRAEFRTAPRPQEPPSTPEPRPSR